MTAALDFDPYLLPLPMPGSPVVLPHRASSLHAHLNGRYSDPAWSLAPLTGNPSVTKVTIGWERWPAAFRDEMRLAAWNLINGQLRPAFMHDRGTAMRSRLSLSAVYNTTEHWKAFAGWLDDKGIRSLADCGPNVLHDYGLHVRGSGRSRDVVTRILISLTRLWALDQVSARPNGIGRPPWEDLGVDDYLPAATGSGGGENATEPIAEQTMGPLLIWAMRMVDDLSGDILAAWSERQRLAGAAMANTATAAGTAALEAFLRPSIANEAPLPASVNQGKTALAKDYISGVTGASRGQVELIRRREGLTVIAAERPGPCPLDVPVPGPDGQAGRHLIRGLEFKTATDEDGNHEPEGAEREVPWVAITPVVNAIRVLERMVPDGHLLFDHRAHDLYFARQGTGSLKMSGLRYRIEDLVAWANREAASQGLAGETIPDDPHGSIGLGRFRRSLAWHIARRPNGLVALAIQYGHMRTALGYDWTTEGYGSRSRGGIHDLIDLETARATADTVMDLHESLGNGGGISGPAARRAIRVAATAPSFAGTPITLASARKLLKNEDAVIYDNPHALVLCHYKREKALCHRDGTRDTPSLDRCVPGCGNIARTDQQAARLRERAARLDGQAASVPQPVGDRLRASAARLRELADRHDRTRITLDRSPA